MSSRRSSFRRREKPAFERFKDHCRHFTAFMFSNVGIILLVTFYTIGGAFVFQAIEIFENEKMKIIKPHRFIERNFSGDCLNRIWELTAENISFFDRQVYRKRVNDALLDYQRAVVKKQLLGPDVDHQWSFSGAFLYSLTVITTIGYGNITPSSDWGKLVTILYAIIGMPLFLLYLSNIGDVLAKSFKWIYSKVCLCRICPGVAKRRIIRERRKLRQLARALQLHQMESARGGSSSSYSSNSNSTSNSSSSSSSDYTKSSVQTSSVLDVPYTDSDSDIEREIRGSTDEITVPLTVCVFVMVSYILSGAILFGRWEDWNYLDGSYFCFISLSSIGFGDLVPGDRVITADKDKVEVSFILCAVYLLLGMALIAMCFNLMQEQVIHNMRAIKRGFKACFRCRSS
ncbi:TWiK family of potassium channels protein 7 [Drosophila sulfurigaster albostrigata]|uniref:TWiK family of potassium channels protein 7 n=1 Tax=Drosophila albomicans TaxID=7291 RepID=A0A6P8X5N5_DROAB|nr:TWiK family of potassium channels protein 7 [Drosophila albomicans]XP_051860852.1 TWiK family of potassium channels protein 7 [Drosophila albomicans]XP_060659028.1 TWiK family of potassium channels protein 7-like isoform X2 [Drosophila nasuta]XP_062131656.1 TWiK family of potassium channels protein 7 [Drosophila sulfurigaster albostrigata]